MADTRPETARRRGERETNARRRVAERGGDGRRGDPFPVPGGRTRARQHGTVPPRYPPADSRPRGTTGRGEARAAPTDTRFASLPTTARAGSLPRNPGADARRDELRTAGAPGAGSIGALPESRFRGTKAIARADGTPRSRARHAACEATPAAPLPAAAPPRGGRRPGRRLIVKRRSDRRSPGRNPGPQVRSKCR